MVVDGASKHPLQNVIDRAKVAFWYAFVLSAGLNMLALTAPIYMMQLFDRVLTGRQEETLVVLTIIAVTALVAAGGLDWARNQVMMRAVAWVERQLSDATIVAGLRATLAGRGLGGQGMRDLSQVRQLLGGRALFTFLDLPWAVLFYLILFVLDFWLGAYAVACGVLIATLAVVGEWSARAQQKRNADRVAEVGHWVDQAVGQAEAIQALGMRGNLLARHRAKLAQAHNEGNRLQVRTETFAAAARAARQTAQIGIMALAAYLLLHGSLSPGLLIASSIILARALAPIDILISTWQQTVSGWAAFSRLQKLLDAASVSDSERTEPPPPRAEIAVTNLHKRLPTSPSGFLLRGINMSLSGGEALGVLGPSGSGKTSLCRTLTGIMQPDLGEVRLDGARLDQWPPDALGAHLGYLPQDVGLPPASVAETIARLAMWPDMNKVYAAAEAADAHNLIMSLPSGYDTPIGANGVPLSGGQRQRIGLARALFGDPVLLVLDEPDAHLDTEGIQSLVRTVDAAKARGAAVVLVTHRSAILQTVERIVVLDAGKIAKLGPRDEILSALKRQNGGNRPSITWAPLEGRWP